MRGCGRAALRCGRRAGPPPGLPPPPPPTRRRRRRRRHRHRLLCNHTIQRSHALGAGAGVRGHGAAGRAGGAAAAPRPSPPPTPRIGMRAAAGAGGGATAGAAGSRALRRRRREARSAAQSHAARRRARPGRTPADTCTLSASRADAEQHPASAQQVSERRARVGGGRGDGERAAPLLAQQEGRLRAEGSEIPVSHGRAPAAPRHPSAAGRQRAGRAAPAARAAPLDAARAARHRLARAMRHGTAARAARASRAAPTARRLTPPLATTFHARPLSSTSRSLRSLHSITRIKCATPLMRFSPSIIHSYLLKIFIEIVQVHARRWDGAGRAALLAARARARTLSTVPPPDAPRVTLRVICK